MARNIFPKRREESDGARLDTRLPQGGTTKMIRWIGVHDALLVRETIYRADKLQVDAVTECRYRGRKMNR